MSSGGSAVARRGEPEWLREDDFREMLERGLQIQREVVHSRYPHMVDGRWIPSSRYYKEGDAERAFSAARLVLATVEGYLRLED